MNKDIDQTKQHEVREMIALEVQSYNEHTTPDGVLATIGGRFSTSAEPSRNNRQYTPDLWRSVVNSDRVKEMLETKTFFGELSHPPRAAEYLSEVQMANMSHNITSLYFDEKTQDLVGKIDILDTPSGRIANTLLKYGSKLGISSRGIVMDTGRSYGGYQDSNEMTPDNYYLVTFDLVALPGIAGARLDKVTEAFNPVSHRLALESLSNLGQSITKATEQKDTEAVKVLRSVFEAYTASSDLAGDPEIKKAIQELSVRDEEPSEPGEPKEPDEVVDDSSATELDTDDDMIDRDDIDAAVLEDANENEDVNPEKDYSNLKNTFDVSEDGTYSSVTGNPVSYNGGYQLSFETESDNYTSEEYNNIVKALVVLTGKEPDIGYWGGNVELSFNVDSLELATELGRKYNQKAIWDWTNMTEIMLEQPKPVVESKLAGKIRNAKSRRKVKPAKEDDSGATQAADIAGPVSTVNVLGPNAELKRFLESVEKIETAEDLMKYVEALDGAETTSDGKVLINKDVALFNTMLNLLRTARIRSDANPLVQPGASIQSMADMESPSDDEPKDKDAVDPVSKPGKLVSHRKSIKASPTHKTSLEATQKLLAASEKIVALTEAVRTLEVNNAKVTHENELLRNKLKANHKAYNEAVATKDAKMKELSAKVTDVEQSRKKAVTESVNNTRNYQAVLAKNESLIKSLNDVTNAYESLKAQHDKERVTKIEDRKDSKIRKLLEAQSFSVSSISDDDEAIAANESAQPEYVNKVKETDTFINNFYRKQVKPIGGK